MHVMQMCGGDAEENKNDFGSGKMGSDGIKGFDGVMLSKKVWVRLLVLTQTPGGPPQSAPEPRSRASRPRSCSRPGAGALGEN